MNALNLQVGPGVQRFEPGDQVFGDLWDHWGGFAEFVCIDEASIEPMPPSTNFLEAAAIPQAGVLALQGIRKVAALEPGQNVLINGAGGGVGTFAIQPAPLAGAEVTGVDAQHKLDVIRSTGANHVLDYTREDFTRTGERYDLIIDSQNFRPMKEIKRALARGGTYALIGASIPRVYELWFDNSGCAPGPHPWYETILGGAIRSATGLPKIEIDLDRVRADTPGIGKSVRLLASGSALIILWEASDRLCGKRL